MKYPRGERVAYIIDDRQKVAAFEDSAEILPVQAADLLAHYRFPYVALAPV
jgi:hypothetical protein